MAIIQPSGTAPIVQGGAAASPQYQSFFRSLVSAIQALQDSSSSGTDLSGITISGGNSISVSGSLSSGTVTITLSGDTSSPGNTWYYGTTTDGTKGWYSLYDAHGVGTGLVQLLDGYAILGELDSQDELPAIGVAGTAYNVDGSYYYWNSDESVWDLLDVEGVVGYRLDELADSGEGALLAITRDEYGRVSGTRTATITGTDGRIVVTNGDASAGLPTIDLAELADSGAGSALVKITRDDYGRVEGTEAATTDDLAEGSNLYFTDERAAAAAPIQSLVAGTNVSIDTTDPQNPIINSTGSGSGTVESVVAGTGIAVDDTDSANPVVGLDSASHTSLALADSAVQPGDLAAVATSGAYSDLSGTPTLGTAAATDSSSYATAAQGALADTALQPGDDTTGNAGTATKLATARTLTVGGTGKSFDGGAAVSWSLTEIFSASQTAGYVLAAPASAAGVPTFRALVNADLPASGATAGTYGATSNTAGTAPVVPYVTINAKGVATAAGTNTLGTAASYAVGTSGDTIPLCSGANTWSGSQDFANGIKVTTNSFELGRVDGSAGTSYLDYHCGATVVDYDARISCSSASGAVGGGTLSFAAAAFAYSGTVRGSTSGSYSLGSATYLWNTVYASNTTISSSDARLKTTPRDLTDVEIAAFSAIARLPMIWQWLTRVETEGDAARLHAGPTVQAAIEIMTANGLDWACYAAFCYDSWESFRGDELQEGETWDGETETEEYTETQPVTETVSVEQQVVEIVDGKAVLATTTVEQEQQVYDEYPLYDSEGNALVDADGNAQVYRVARTETVTKTRTYKVIEAGDRYSFRKEELLWLVVRATLAEIDKLTA